MPAGKPMAYYKAKKTPKLTAKKKKVAKKK